MKKWTIEWAMKKYPIVFKGTEKNPRYTVGKKEIYRVWGEDNKWFNNDTDDMAHYSERAAVRWLVDGAERRKKWELVNDYEITDGVGIVVPDKGYKIVVTNNDGTILFKKYKRVTP